MLGWNKLFVVVVGFIVTGVSGPDPWLFEVIPMLPEWVPALIATVGVGLVPNGRAFWQVTQPSK